MSHHTLWRPPLHPIHPPLHLIYCPPNDTNTLSSWYPSIPYPLAISRQRSIEFVSTFGEGIWCTPHLQHLWCARLQPWWPYSTLPRLHDDRRSSLYAWQRPVPVGAPSNSAQTRLVHDIWCRGRSGFIGRGWPLLWFCQQCLYCQLIPTHTIQTAITTIEWRGRTLFSDHYRRGIGNRNDNNQLRVSNFRNQSMVWLCGTHCNTYWWILWAEYSTDTSNTTINWIWAPQAWSIQHRHGEGPSTLPLGWSWIGENMTNDFWLFQCTLLKRIECRLEE